MADALSARQQIIDKIKESSNILVTVSRDPSVDELSAALGATLLLNKMGKHATCVMSGQIPSALEFLSPEKTFENSVDSLRDFIIALDKEKADHLRYKVDGDVVKIFITPYRTTLSQSDLDFSQGDYNVELVLGLAVKQESDLDEALEAHGKILHDAVVATIDNEGEASKLGSIDWRDLKASSVSEMIADLIDGIKDDKAKLDDQIATAILTGIVAATDRFSNDMTSSKVMTTAAQLMAAGANQQLIASKLEEAHEIGEEKSEVVDKDVLSEGETTKIDRAEEKPVKKAKEADGSAGALAISHEKSGDLDEVASQVAAENSAAAVDEATDALDEVARQTAIDNNADAALAAEQKLAEDLQANIPGSVPSTEPLFSGTLNATTEQAALDKQLSEESDKNRTLLTHGETGHVENAPLAPPAPAFNATQLPSEEPASVDPFAMPAQEPAFLAQAPSLEPQLPPPFVLEPAPATEAPGQTLADIDASVRQPHEDAMSAVQAAFGAPDSAAQAAPSPDLGGTHPLESAQAAATPLGELPPLPDISTLPPLPPMPTLPPMPSDFSTNIPQMQVDTPQFGAPQAPAFEPQASADPNQFQIPGQG